MDTIVVPRDLKQLHKRLPPPSYDSDIVRPSVPPPSSSGAGGPPGVQRSSSWSQGAGIQVPAAPSSAPNSKPPTPSGGAQGIAPKLPSLPGGWVSAGAAAGRRRAAAATAVWCQGASCAAGRA